MIVNLPKKTKDSIDLGAIDEMSAGIILTLRKGKPVGYITYYDGTWYWGECLNIDNTQYMNDRLMDLVENLIDNGVMDTLEFIPFE